MQGFMIAGERSGVGKTMLTLGLARAMQDRGLRVQCFKVGPDFIDPGYHLAVTGRPSLNLDGWMMGRQHCLSCFGRHARGADLALVEGVMGLFDGCDGVGEDGSSAQIAKWLGLPVILVIDGSSLARTAGAIVLGFEQYDVDLKIAGIIFNRVAGRKHFEMLQAAVRQRCRAEVLGYVPRGAGWQIPERHLGLIMASETEGLARTVADLAATLRQSLSLETIRGYCCPGPGPDAPLSDPPCHAEAGPPVRIGVARDEAFCFYYQENLEFLEQQGGRICNFSPIHDQGLPPGLHGIYLGGGYPELHAAALQVNRGMREQIRAFCRSGRPVYAECGGFLFLLQAIAGQDGRRCEMVGLFPAEARMQPRLSRLGYVEIEALPGCGFLGQGQRARGHEFHYSEIAEMPAAVERCYRVHQGRGAEPRTEGYRIHNVLASYIHLHFASNPDFARNFVSLCRGNQAT